MNSMSPDELSEDEKAEADAALNQAVGEDCDKLSKAILHLRRALRLVPEEGVFEANDKFFVEERRWDGAHKYLKVPNGGWVLAEATSENHGPTTLCNELKVHAGGYPPLSNIPNPDKQGQASTAACTQTRATCEGAMIQFALSAPIRR